MIETFSGVQIHYLSPQSGDKCLQAHFFYGSVCINGYLHPL